jgi:predicted dehydrogenase
VLLPALKDVKNVNLKGVATATGASGKKVAQKFGFEYCTTNSEEILGDQGIDTVFIATRHNLHVPIAVTALKKGKAVFMEKPMALNEAELGELLKVWEETGGRLMVGFNRRFSPLIDKMKIFFSGRREPLQMIYRVNAGFLPKDHWVHDPKEGGGRIVGEACHFVDLFCF